MSASTRRLMSEAMARLALGVSGAYYGTPKVEEKYRRHNLTVKPDEHFYQNKFKSQKKEEHEFVIDGKKVMAYSRKDAIKRLKHS